MTQAYNNLCVEYFPGDPCRCRLIAPLKAYSDTIGRDIEAPIGFVNDLESVPIVKGTNNESGVWETAAAEMRNSKWFGQVGRRAEKIVKLIAEG